MEWAERPAVEAARLGADPHRPIDGEDVSAQSSEVARHWLKAYAELVELEADLLALLAERLPQMGPDARQEAEETNLPVIVSQLQRFRHRMDYWRKRRDQIDHVS